MFTSHRNPVPPNVPYGSVPNQRVGPPRELMHEVSVYGSIQACPGPATGEIRKTISLSEEYSKSRQCPWTNLCSLCNDLS